MDILTNKWLQLEISEEGAEIHRIAGIRTGIEYLWKGDAAYWDRHSPLLFPLVGKVSGGKSLINGIPYELPKHGFVSQEKFKKIEGNEHQITYRLESTAKMHKIYPFPFRLDVNYKLRANYINVTWKIMNMGIYDMPFQIGGHPGINYPDFNPDSVVKAYLSFRRPSPIESAAVCDTGCLGPNRYDLPMNKEGLLPVTDECFSNDAIIIDHSQVSHVDVLDIHKQPYVSMDFQSPVLLLWSPYGIKAPFVCLEPWYGLCDVEGYSGEFSDRPYTSSIEPGRQAMLGYTLRMDAEISRQALSVKKVYKSKKNQKVK